MKWLPLIASFIAIGIGIALFCLWVIHDER